MSFRVVIDSCGELTDEMKKSGNFVSAPLTLQVDEYIVQDDEEHFNQTEFLKKVAECPNCPKSSCPSPEIYRDAYDCDADHVYAVTLSEWILQQCSSWQKSLSGGSSGCKSLCIQFLLGICW